MAITQLCMSFISLPDNTDLNTMCVCVCVILYLYTCEDLLNCKFKLKTLTRLFTSLPHTELSAGTAGGRGTETAGGRGTEAAGPPELPSSADTPVCPSASAVSLCCCSTQHFSTHHKHEPR